LLTNTQVNESVAQTKLLLGGKQNGCYHRTHYFLGEVTPGMPAFDQKLWTFGCYD
jgi:hypothetical protein